MKDFSTLLIKQQTRHKTKQKRLSVHIGYDTETLNGYCRLICDSNANYLYIGAETYQSDEKILTDILNFLIRNAGRSALRWFYNINYDFRAIVKYLSSDKLIELYNNNETRFNDFKISYLPSKFFRISKNNHSVTFYDIAHFFAGGLNPNAEKYLGIGKIKEVNRNILGISKDYWDDNKYQIIEYCIRDCELTAKLADLFYLNLWNEIKFNPKNPYSAGSISQEFFINNSAFIPIIDGIPEKILQLHQNYYRGGRIEIMKKGFFKSLDSYDLKSAYPSVMIDLLDYTNGKWVKSNEFDDKIHGIYRIKYNWLNSDIGVFPQTVDNLTIYPNIINGMTETVINEQELIFLDNHANDCDYEIIEGYQFIPYIEQYPYRNCLLQLFEQKEIAEEEKNDNKRMIYKLFINSIYGKTAEAIYNKSSGKYETGRLYNPIYANRITSLTRLKLLEASYNISNYVVGFSTDSILTEKPISNRFIENKLGKFTHEYTAFDSIVLMSGIRYIQTKNNKKQGEIEIKQKLRGFTDDIEKMNLKELLEQNRNKAIIETYINKPLTLFQSLAYNDLTKNDINVFVPALKKLDINGDLRRLWNDNFTNAEDCMNRNISSHPIPI